jgi:hypothetical protein
MSSIRLDSPEEAPPARRTNIVQLRDLLGERFPQVRMGLAEKSLIRPCFATGLAQIDGLLEGGLAKGQITEFISSPAQSGGALVLRRILRLAGRHQQRTALIDGSDGFDPGALTNDLLAHLLWVRCRDAAQALKATDLVLRDGNLPLVLLDLHHNPAVQLRKIPGTTWYRLQRIIEPTPATLLVLTPRALVSSAETRLAVAAEFGLPSLQQTEDDLVAGLKIILRRSVAGEVRELISAEAG